MKPFSMKLKVTVNPNPFTTELIVFISGYFAVNIVLRLVTENGKVVRITSCAVVKGQNNVAIRNPGRLAKGNYYLEIKLLNGDLLQTIPLVKS